MFKLWTNQRSNLPQYYIIVFTDHCPSHQTDVRLQSHILQNWRMPSGLSLVPYGTNGTRPRSEHLGFSFQISNPIITIKLQNVQIFFLSWHKHYPTFVLA